ncbi:MAG: nucleoside hydrolase [Candidatus Bathyarchaeia archaeon]
MSGVGRRVIIDTDPGIGVHGSDVDDGLAILLALASEELRVEAITVVAGNVEAEQGTRNALNLLEMAGVEGVPVARGSEKPLKRSLVTGSSLIKRRLEMLGYREEAWAKTVPARERKVHLRRSSQHAVDLITSKVSEHPGETTVITIGPLTNMATALIKEPNLAKDIRELIVMGGAIAVPGNATPVAEFNVWCDPEAAKAVFNSGVPMTMVGLDVTKRTLLTTEHLAEIRSSNTPVARFIADMTEAWIGIIRRLRGIEGCWMHDPLAVAVAIDPTLVTTERMFVDVETRGEITSGQTVGYAGKALLFHGKEANANVCVDVDVDRFLGMLVQRLSTW